MFSLAGKVALVTGGSRGLGRADALALARAGADVVITDILIESDQSPETDKYGPLAQVMRSGSVVYAEKTAEQIRQMGRRSFAMRMDVTDHVQVREVFARVKEELGGVHILVNNAATLDHVGQIESQSDEFWERDLRVNLTGAFNCCKAVWPMMKEQNWGRVVNMASVAGTLGGFGQASYSTTKAGLIGLTRTLALEGARFNINANVVVPGIIATESFNFTNPKMRERMIARTAFKRPGEPDDIAHAIVFLVSEEARYITGVALNVSGGIELFTF
ncbi:MAG: SDR family NAD(P)-dependent oxidoreductase [Bacillota bacterium]